MLKVKQGKKDKKDRAEKEQILKDIEAKSSVTNKDVINYVKLSFELKGV